LLSGPSLPSHVTASAGLNLLIEVLTAGNINGLISYLELLQLTQ